jgi:Tfp pilus assembly protein PilN
VADAATSKREHQGIFSRATGSAFYMKLVTDAIPAESHFTSVKINTGQITVAGEANNPFKVVEYVQALEALGKFTEVRIISLDDVKSTGDNVTATATVAFNIVISKKA